MSSSLLSGGRRKITQLGPRARCCITWDTGQPPPPLSSRSALCLPILQHVYNFAALLLVPANGSTAGPAGLPAAKRQLDCAGVVTTTYAACQALAARHPAEHADLAAARMQISEDHCWLNLGADGGRDTSVEVTTDAPAKRGLPVAPEGWAGWLYTGGRAVLCTPHQALAALVTSVNPAVAGGKKGVDSEELQAVQRRLLEVLAEARPSSLYPAALCALADLKEVRSSVAGDGDGCVAVMMLCMRPQLLLCGNSWTGTQQHGK